MCGAAHSHVFSIRLYVLNTFLVLPNVSVFSIQDEGGENYIPGYSSESR